MVDIETFLTTLYVIVDEYCKSELTTEQPQRGPQAALSRSEVITLAVFGQWSQFESERSFYRYAQRHLRSAFPTLPEREQFNRLMRASRDAIAAFGLFLVRLMQAQRCPYELLDSSGVAVRDAKRRGAGWLAGQADIGWSTRLGWYEGFHLLCAITPEGVITGFGFGPASTHDQRLAETFFAARAWPTQILPSAGAKAPGVYIADKGFAGDEPHTQWRELYGAEVISPPQQGSKKKWPKEWRRWLARLRQVVETIYDKLLNSFRLGRERPHDLTGFQARLAAKVSLHNFCIWFNGQLGREPLAFADLLAW
jgi:Transposase DDE domain